MREVIVVQGKARETVLAALRERGYDVGADAGPGAAADRACAACCAAEKAVETFQRLHAETGSRGGLYRFVVQSVEKPLIENALRRTGGNQVRAARLLGINRNTLRLKMQRLRIGAKHEAPV